MPAEIRLEESLTPLLDQDTLVLRATAIDSEGQPISGLQLDWSSSDSNVLRVTSSGPDGAVLLAAAPGSAVVTVSYGSLSASKSVTVWQRPVDLVYISGSGQSGPADSQLPDSLVVRTIDRRGDPVPGVEIAFTVAAGGGDVAPWMVATDEDGRSAALWTLGADGAQRVEARVQGPVRHGSLKDSVVVFTATVGQPAPDIARLQVTPDSVAMAALGEVRQLAARATDSTGAVVSGVALHWRSLDDTVAGVDAGGHVSARAVGTALIVVTAAAATDTAEVVVRQLPASVAVEPAALTLDAGGSARLQATVSDSGGSPIPGSPVAWSSSAPNVVAVDGQGGITALTPGSASVRASSGNVTGASEVTVNAPQSASGFGREERPYTGASPWNTPVPADAPIDPASDAMIATIAASSTGRLRSDPSQYAYPVYFADAATPRVTLECVGWVSVIRPDGTREGLPGRLEGVPIPASASPSEGSDGQIIVVDTETGDEYDIWQFVPPNGCTSVTKYEEGVYRDAVEPEYTSRGAGVPYLAGLIRPWEIEQGRIEHALAFGYTLSRQERCVWPAAKTDGDDDRPDAIPEGARIRLDPAVDVEAIPGLDATGRIIARALQEYGMILIDNSGANKIYAEDDRTAAWGDRLTTSTVDAIPVDRLQVLRLPDAYWADTYQPDHGRCVR